jgi:hypothetical protein
MEEAAELANYLPLSFKTPKEQESIEFLSLLDDLEAKLRKQEQPATRLAESLSAAVAA